MLAVVALFALPLLLDGDLEAKPSRVRDLVATLRRRLHDLDDRAAGEMLQDGLRSSQTNLELLRQVQRSAAGPAAGSAQRG